MSVGRYAAALDLITIYLARGTDEEQVVLLVEQGLRGLLENDDPEMRRLQQWNFEQLFSLLERHKSLLGEARLASLEWAYLPALGHEPNIPALHSAMADDPSFFVDVVKTVYRPRTRDKSEERGRQSKQRERQATNAYRLLSSWSCVPGLSKNGSTVEATALNAWTQDVVRLLEQADRTEVGLIHVGRMLASSPPDPDGIWPGEAVRELIEELQNEKMEEGLRMEILNRRGITTRSPGDGGMQEVELAAKYADQARNVADISPRSAAILRTVAAIYESEARHEDQHAEKFRSGLDD
jgi:hypothetical protein